MVSPRVSPGSRSKAGKAVPDPAAAARTEAAGKISRRVAHRTRGRACAEREACFRPQRCEISAARRWRRSPDLAAFNERIAKIEGLMRAQGAEIAQQGSKLADTKAAEAKPADDMPLRRVVAAALLDVLVRTGDPYPAALSTAKSLAPNPDALKPLDQFADKGVPNADRLSARIAGAGAEAVRRPRSRTRPRPARALSSGCRQAPPNWSRSSAPTPPATIAVPWSRGSPRRRCATISTRRGAN